MSARLPWFVHLEDVADLRKRADAQAKRRKAARKRTRATRRANR